MEWFDDDALWANLKPFLFSEERQRLAPIEVERLIALTSCTSGSVLDLACGTGRHALELARRDFHVTAVDRTKSFLAEAQAAATAQGVSVEWIHSDMRQFVRKESFDLVINMGTSFGFFKEPSASLAVLSQCYENLRSGGVLVIDLKGKECLARDFRETVSENEPGGTKCIQQLQIVNDWTEVLNEWTLIKDEQVKTVRFSLFLYSGQELRTLLQTAGFSSVRLYGDLEGNEYGAQAERLIAVAKKSLPVSDPKSVTRLEDTKTPAAVVEVPPPKPIMKPEKPAPVAPAPVAAPKPIATPAAPRPLPRKKTEDASSPKRAEATPSKFFGRFFTPPAKKKVARKVDMPAVAARPWWHNCTKMADHEIGVIDGMEHDMPSLDERTKRLRILISRLRMSHHEADEHVAAIIKSIGSGELEGTDRIFHGPGPRKQGEEIPPTERMWRSFIDILSAWCMGNMSTIMYMDPSIFGSVNPMQALGQPTAIKMWQVQQVIAKLRVGSGLYPTAEYIPMMDHRDQYQEQSKFYDRTVKATIHDTEDGEPAVLSLARAIDDLEPWHWNFRENIIIVLRAINGMTHSKTPFCSPTRNMALSPMHDLMVAVCHSLRWFAFPGSIEKPAKAKVLDALGEPSPSKHWLSASLDKTIRLQMKLDE